MVLLLSNHFLDHCLWGGGGGESDHPAFGPPASLFRHLASSSITPEILMCGGGVRSILLLPLVARCLETKDVCMWCMFVFMSVVVTVWGSVGMFVV